LVTHHTSHSLSPVDYWERR
jgi:hypothetical protein